MSNDLFVINSKIFKEDIQKGVSKSILVKLNQIGTVSEAIEIVILARANGYTT